MAFWMWILIVFIIGQRIVELIIARSNERWMKERGGIESGTKHYHLFIILHCLFFICIISESVYFNRVNLSINYFLLLIFILAQVARFWCIYSLGRFWNTKVIVLPRVALIRKGPYKYFKHPNYVIVGIELFVIPLLIGAYLSALVFPILHVLLLRIRIPTEEKALVTHSKI